MARGIAAVAIALAACGRVNFATVESSSDHDASVAIDGVPLVCGPAYQPVAGLTSKYRRNTVTADWFGAQADCESDGGHLVVIDSAAENDYVVSQRDVLEIWIGLSDHATEGTMRWVTGAPLTFQAFKPNEPNDQLGVEDCVNVSGTGEWNDIACRFAPVDYICECDLVPLPATPTYCDTETAESCGECGKACASICSDQICVDSS